MTELENELGLRHAALTPLGTAGRVDSIVTRIAASIRLGLMVDGEQLPSEADLANRLQVSTMSLRESLSQLRAVGLIETRRGRNGGSFVRYRPEVSVDSIRDSLHRNTTTGWRDLGEEHTAVAGRIAWLAARRATVSDVERVSALVDELTTARTVAARQRADSRFHIGLAVAAQSERLTRSEVRLQNDTIELVWASLKYPIDPAVAAEEHRSIIEAVAAEDENRARAEAEGHVRRNMQRIIQMSLEAVAENETHLTVDEGGTLR